MSCAPEMVETILVPLALDRIRSGLGAALLSAARDVSIDLAVVAST